MLLTRNDYTSGHCFRTRWYHQIYGENPSSMTYIMNIFTGFYLIWVNGPRARPVQPPSLYSLSPQAGGCIDLTWDSFTHIRVITYLLYPYDHMSWFLSLQWKYFDSDFNLIASMISTGYIGNTAEMTTFDCWSSMISKSVNRQRHICCLFFCVSSIWHHSMWHSLGNTAPGGWMYGYTATQDITLHFSGSGQINDSSTPATSTCFSFIFHVLFIHPMLL